MTRLLPWAKMPPARLGDLDFEFFMQEIPLFLICLNSTTVFRSACVTVIEELNVQHLTLVKKRLAPETRTWENERTRDLTKGQTSIELP